MVPVKVLVVFNELQVCGEMTGKAFFWHAFQIFFLHGGDV